MYEICVCLLIIGRHSTYVIHFLIYYVYVCKHVHSLFQARMVAAATNNLCEAANSAVQGHASEEKLISSAKQVAASTAQLLVACKVKADQDSQTMKRLQVSFGEGDG